MKLFGASTMRELDRITIEEVGIPGIVLMENAGRGAADHIEAMARDRGPVLVFAGPGNNGGDGFVVARHLCDRGLEVVVCLLARPEDIKGDAAIMFKALKAFPARVVEVMGSTPEAILEAAPRYGVAVDAIFGTGLSRPVEGVFANAVEAMNALPCPRVALDIPTGIEADTGRILGTAVQADLTITFGAAKVGHFSFPGRACCGRVVVVPIGIPRSAIEAASGAILIGPEQVRAAFGRRPLEAFKNSFGHVFVVGGMPGKAGAALLAAMAATRFGAGLVTIATHPDSAAHLEGRCPELMVEAGLGPALSRLEGLIARASAVIVGPGLGTEDQTPVRLALDRGVPVVLDADALNLIAANPNETWPLRPDVVMTPHPGEAARLLGTTTAKCQADRVTTARRLCDRFGATIVLKGAGTIVASPDGRLAINPTGGPALATAGSGDVLAGMIGALIGRSIAPFDAACASVYLHGLAGEVAAGQHTEHGVAAFDVVQCIGPALKSLLHESRA